MGILDSLESSGILGKLGAAVLPAVLGEVLGSGGQGGLNAIVARLQQAGLGDIAKSWVGTPWGTDDLQVWESYATLLPSSNSMVRALPLSPACRRTALRVVMTSAPNRSDCLRADVVSSAPETPVGKPR